MFITKSINQELFLLTCHYTLPKNIFDKIHQLLHCWKCQKKPRLRNRMFPPHLLKRKNMAMMLDRSSSSSSSSDSGSSSSSSDSDSESSPASGSDRCWTFTKVVDDFHSGMMRFSPVLQKLMI